VVRLLVAVLIGAVVATGLSFAAASVATPAPKPVNMVITNYGSR